MKRRAWPVEWRARRFWWALLGAVAAGSAVLHGLAQPSCASTPDCVLAVYTYQPDKLPDCEQLYGRPLSSAGWPGGGWVRMSRLSRSTVTDGRCRGPLQRAT